MTPREPDRFDAIVARWRRGPRLDEQHFRECLRAAESSALERAAQVADRYKSGVAILIADSIRALIPPAAAPAAERAHSGQCASTQPGPCICDGPAVFAAPAEEPRLDNLAAESPAPAAEAGKAQGLRGLLTEILHLVIRWHNLYNTTTRDYRDDGIAGILDSLQARLDAALRILATSAPAQWRVGNHYQIHVYEGDRPVATFFRAEDARRAVDAVRIGWMEKYDAAEALLRECEAAIKPVREVLGRAEWPDAEAATAMFRDLIESHYGPLAELCRTLAGRHAQAGGPTT